MVVRKALTKSKIRVERNSKEIVLVVCDGVSSASSTMLANEVARKTAREGKRRALIYVVSPLGRPEYFEVVRSVIQENVGLSMSIRYFGSKPADLLELINELGNPDVIIAGFCSDFIQALDETGYENVTVIYPKGVSGDGHA